MKTNKLFNLIGSILKVLAITGAIYWILTIVSGVIILI